MAICQVCNFRSPNLIVHILSEHSLSVDDYKVKFPKKKLVLFEKELVCLFCSKSFLNFKTTSFCSKQCRRYHKLSLKPSNVLLEKCNMCNHRASNLSQHYKAAHGVSRFRFLNKAVVTSLLSYIELIISRGSLPTVQDCATYNNINYHSCYNLLKRLHVQGLINLKTVENFDAVGFNPKRLSFVKVATVVSVSSDWRTVIDKFV